MIPQHVLTGFLRRSAISLVLVAGAFLSSCVSHSTLTSDGLKRRGVKPGEGLIVGTFDVKSFDSYGDPYSVKSNIARVTGKSKDAKTFELCPTQLGDSRTGFAVPVPAGDYEITGWQLTSISGPGGLTITNRLPMKVPFKVVAGEAVYVGRMNAFFLHGKALIGVQVLADGAVLASDRQAEDVKIITGDYPVVRGMKVRKSDVPALYMREIKRTVEIPKTWKEEWFPGW